VQKFYTASISHPTATMLSEMCLFEFPYHKVQ